MGQMVLLAVRPALGEGMVGAARLSRGSCDGMADEGYAVAARSIAHRQARNSHVKCAAEPRTMDCCVMRQCGSSVRLPSLAGIRVW